MTIAVIDERTLLRECFARGIEAVDEGISVLCFPTITEWQVAASRHSAVSLILFCSSGRRPASNDGEIHKLATSSNGVPVILVSDQEHPEEVFEAISQGARGFIPASIDLHLALMAMRLVKAGGVYLPESIVFATAALKRNMEHVCKRQPHHVFTERQAAVVDALRQGKPNKIIAYELKMRESTVKVHIRNVMKKLNAKNRTEVAFIASRLIYDDFHGRPNTATQGYVMKDADCR